MRDKGIKPVYISTTDTYSSTANDKTLTFDDVFNTTLPNDQIKFLFESPYAPYAGFVRDKLDHIDLVICAGGTPVRPLEVKLTVLPDNATGKSEDQSKWGSELVIRPDSISYACLGIYSSLRNQAKDVLKIIEPAAEAIEKWDSAADIARNAPAMREALTELFRKYHEHQSPFVIQPLWRTVGTTPQLDENAFDVFVWSDFALLKTAMDQAFPPAKPAPATKSAGKRKKTSKKKTAVKISRPLRSVARTLQALNELFSTEKVNVSRIFRGTA